MNLPVYIWWTVHSTLEAVGCSRFQDLCPFLSAMHRIMNFNKFYSKWKRKFKVCSQSWFASGLISVSLKEVGCFVWGSLVIFSDCFPDRVPTHLLNLCFSTPSEKKDVSDHQDCKPFKDLLGEACAGWCLQRHTHLDSPFLMRSEGLFSHVDDAFLWWSYYRWLFCPNAFYFCSGKRRKHS